jgi:Bacterial Ig-like domain (group 2)/Bacterial Ig domain
MKTIFTIIGLVLATVTQAQTAPIFTGGAKQNISICKNANTTIIDNKMIVQDPDATQTITYTIATAPINGTVHGFPQSVSTGTGGLVAPTGFDYQPTNNYFGLDSFVVSITDGTYTTQTKIIVTINNLPIVAAITGNTTACAGSTGTQLFNTTPTGVWSSSNTAIATSSNIGFITPISQGNTNIIYKVTNTTTGCSDSVMATFQVGTVPILQPITGAIKVCQKNTTQLANSTTGGIWQSIDTNIAKISNTGLVTGLMPGTTTIKYTYTNVAGCSSTVITNFKVDSLPKNISISTYQTTICVGSYTIVFNDSSTGVWSSKKPTIATVDNTGYVSGKAIGIATIMYKVTTANGCVDSSKIDIRVAAAPIIAPILGPSTICVGKKATMTNATVGGIWGAINLPKIATIDATGVVSAISTGTAYITYTVYGASGCDLAVEKSVTIMALPTLTNIVGNNQVCIGTTTTGA